MVVSDVHVHLLPGLDDGPRDEPEAVALAGELAADGVRRVATTPHLRADYPDVRPAELARRVAALQERIQREEIDLDLVTAGEVAIEWAVSASDEDLRLVSYGQRGTDLLVETPYGPIPAILYAFGPDSDAADTVRSDMLEMLAWLSASPVPST